MSNSFIWPIDRTLSGPTSPVQRAMAMKEYSAFPEAPPLLDGIVSYQDTCWGSFTPLQRCSRCILQLQPTEPTHTHTHVPCKTITDADYTDDIALLANAPAEAESLLYSLEQVTAGIGLHANAHKTEYIYQTGDISTLNSNSLKLVNKFTYLGSSVQSTATDINMWLAKAWTAIDRLSVIWKSNLINKIKLSSSGRVDTAVWMHYIDAN